VTEGVVVAIGREALLLVLLVAGPVLGLGLVVGLAVSIFQAVTQIQEQTLIFVPKIAAALVAIAIWGSWMLQTLIEYAENLIGSMHLYVK